MENILVFQECGGREWPSSFNNSGADHSRTGSGPSVELVEPSSASSSSRAIQKAPTLPKDISLALRQAKSIVAKEDMDEYAKLNTDVVKKALAHPLMKVGFLFFLSKCLHLFDPRKILCFCAGFDRGHGDCQSVYALGGWLGEAESPDVKSRKPRCRKPPKLTKP